MAVKVNSERKGIEISWDTLVESGPPEEKPPDQPPAFPTHPIFLPPYVDASPPVDQPEIDNELPGEQPEIDNELPGDQPEVSHPIYLPPYIDNSLPGEAAQKLREFLTGNLPPFDYVAPTGGKDIACQVFAQGQDGDWSNSAVQPNDGLAFLSYPKGFAGESYVEIRALDGRVIDSGTITVK
jgi:hypothetical protein